MSLLKDFREQNLSIRKLYWPRELVNPANWGRAVKWRNQRTERGWSDRDTWGGGEHIASVSAGILRELGKEKNIVDWDWYFRNNAWETLGYKNLNEVAQDIENWLAWEEMSFDEPIYEWLDKDNDTRWAIEHQLYEDYRQAMVFVAKNIGGLWW
jgi:hypothetical protein